MPLFSITFISVMAIQMKKNAGLLVLLLVPLLFQAQTVVLTEGCQSAYNDILSLKFDAGQKKLEAEKAAKPDNLYPVYLENYIDFLTLFIGENKDDLDRLEDNKSVRLELISRLSDTSPYKKYMLGNIRLQWAVARLKFGEYFTAALEINRAYRLLEDNHRAFPGFIPNGISLGVLHIMIGLVPENYRWILSLISIEGTVEQGRSELYKVLRQSSLNPSYAYLRNEVLFYLGFVELNLSPDKKQALDLLTKLQKAKHDNLLLSYLVINIQMRTGQNERALEAFARIQNREGFYPFYYLDYLEGECLLRKLETEAARKKYENFLKNFSGKNYLKDAWRKMAWTALLQGDTPGYFNFLEKVATTGNDDVDVDKQALREAKSGSPPHTGLLKATLLFDGGYYHRAVSVLGHISPGSLTPEQQLEKTYRQARIADETGNRESAKRFYTKTIEKGKDSPRYFAANAALKLAGIYESEGDLKQAEKFYRLCLKMDFTEYRESIRSKAKTGLKRVIDKQD